MAAANSTKPGGSRARNFTLVFLGGAIVLATYLYLVIAQPADMQNTATNQGGLIAIAGYLVGAVLLAAGSIHRLPTTTIVMIPAAIALNIAVGQSVATIGLPLYLDSIGTVVVASVAGPAAGVVAGILTNVIWGLTLSPVALPFAVVQVAIGILAGVAARLGLFRRIWTAPIAGFLTGIVAGTMSAPISAFVFGGTTGNAGGAAIFGAFRAMGQSVLQAATWTSLSQDPLDKAIVFTLVVIILAALPTRFLGRFPFVREHRVMGKVAAKPRPVLSPAPAAPAASATSPGE
jgi:energy-coupling factor transport system substrate-specific component